MRLDIKAEAGDGRPLDIEVQNKDEGAEPKRARYNSSLLDANALKKGEDYDKHVNGSYHDDSPLGKLMQDFQ